MKITSQLLRKHAVGALEDAQYIDLSGKKIAVIEHLEECHKLQTLILQHNNIDSIRNVDCCSELWTIDMTGNKLKSLNGLSQFPVLGSLILSNNELDWQELKKLSHAHTLSLILTGNERLVSDNHYRKHVIDVLPHLWMLDGQLITAGERKRVLHFFEKSASSLQPVRHKSNTRSVFIPSSRKNLLVTGVFGERTTVLMTKFPLQEVHNIDLDRRRLSHLTVLMEEDLKIESDYMKRKGQSSFIVPGLCRLLEIRVKETEQCNMLLLLLVAMLEFDLPHGLMLATIDTAKLGFIGDVRCQDIISLPPQVILKVISVLISAAAIDKDDNKDGGLYLQLYQCLQAIVYSLHGKVHSITTHMDIQQSTPSRSTTPTFSTTSSTLFTSSHKSSSSSSQYTHQRCLLASEVVHLMCLVPTFFDLLDSNKGIVDMVAVATRNQYVANVISHIKWTVYNDGGNIWDIYHEMASYLLQTTTSNVFRKRKALPASSSSSSSSSNPNSLRHTSSQIIQTPRRSSHLPPPRAQSAGAVASFRRRHPTPNQPDLGDFVLCAPERLARIVALPETYVAVLQLSSSVHNSSVPPDSYFYTDTRGLIWDGTQGHWTKDDLTCDLSAGRLYTYSDITDTIHNPNSRPVSQLSCISEDLQTIPSVEELNLADDTVELKDEVDKEDGREEVTVRGDLKEDNDKEIEFSLRVDISSREGLIPPRSNTPEEIEATLQHQQTVLQHYSLSQCSIDKHETEKEDELTHPFSAKKEWMTNKQVSIEEDENIDQLTIPIPKLNHLETWESTKSLPQSVFSSSPPKPHSCNKVDISSKYPSRDEVEKRLSSTIDMSPFHKRQSRPLLVHAWTTVKSGHPKQTMLSSTRMANRSSKISPSLSISYQTSQDSVISRHLPPSSSSSSSSLVHEPRHMTTYNTHARMLKNKYQFQPKKLTASTKGHSSPRKLGDVHSLSVLGASVW